jgi:hypothetical protein
VVDDACRAVGRDPAEVERTVAVLVRMPGGTGRNEGGYAAARNRPIEGSADEIADVLGAFAAEGIGHVQLVVDPITRASVDGLVPVLRALEVR